MLRATFLSQIPVLEKDGRERTATTQNAFAESFNARLRKECLDQELFLNLEDAKRKIETWRRFYNDFRPHSALGGMPPSRFAAEYHKQLLSTGT